MSGSLHGNVHPKAGLLPTVGALFALLLATGLAPVAAQEVGYIQVKCPPGVRVFLDGTFAGTTQPDIGLVLENVPVGSHRVKATRDGYAPWERDVTLRKGQVLVVEVDTLRRAVVVEQSGESADGGLRQETGNLRVQSIPVDCVIVVAELGQTIDKVKDTVDLKGVPVGAYEVVGRRQGSTLRRQVRVDSGATRHILFNFLRGTVEDVGEVEQARQELAGLQVRLAQLEGRAGEVDRRRRELADLRRQGLILESVFTSEDQSLQAEATRVSGETRNVRRQIDEIKANHPGV